MESVEAADKSMGQGWRRVDSVCLSMVGVVLVAEGIRLMTRRAELGIWRERVGPDTYMVGVGAFLLVLTCLEALAGRRATRRVEHQEGSAVLKSLLLLVGYVVVVPFLGFTVSTVAFLLVYMVWVARKGIITGILFSGAVAGVYYLVLYKVAMVVLPRGFVGF